MTLAVQQGASLRPRGEGGQVDATQLHCVFTLAPRFNCTKIYRTRHDVEVVASHWVCFSYSWLSWHISPELNFYESFITSIVLQTFASTQSCVLNIVCSGTLVCRRTLECRENTGTPRENWYAARKLVCREKTGMQRENWYAARTLVCREETGMQLEHWYAARTQVCRENTGMPREHWYSARTQVCRENTGIPRENRFAARKLLCRQKSRNVPRNSLVYSLFYYNIILIKT